MRCQVFPFQKSTVWIALFASGAVCAQTWVPMGSAPVYELATSTPAYTNVSGITQGAYQNPAQGAMSGLLPGATAGTYFASAVNGGVWTSTDSGATWTAIGDKLPSLSVASMVYDAASSQQKIWVGFGHKSALSDLGGYLAGVAVYDTTNRVWSTPAGNATLANKNITQIAVSGSNIFVGAKGAATGQGLWISDNSGTTFSQVNTSTSGFKAGDVTSVVQYSSGGITTVYAGLVSTNTADTGVYASTNNGSNWTKISGIGNFTTSVGSTARIMLALGADGSAIASLLTPNGDNSQVNVFKISQSGSTFSSSSLGQPIATINGQSLYLYNGGQYYPHAALVVDPTNPNRFYIGGDRVASITAGNPLGATIWNGNLFRGTYNPTTGVTTWEPITNNFALNNSAPHADARYLYIDASGNLLEGDDGGIYYRTNPTSSNGQWNSLNGNIQSTEMHTARWNSLTHTVLGAMQDNGTYFQSSPKSPAGYAVNGGDGGIAEVNPNWNYAGSTNAALYSSYTNLQSLYRTRVNSSGQYQGTTNITLTLQGTNTVINGDEKTAQSYFPFTPTFALNSQDKTRFIAGGYYLFLGQDSLANGTLSSSGTYDLNLEVKAVSPAVASTDYYYRTIAYGASNNANALVAGTASSDFKNLTAAGGVYYSSNATTTNVQPIYTSTTGIQAAIFDRQLGTADVYFTDSQKILRIQNPVDGQTATPTDISGNLLTTYSTFKEIRGLTHVYGQGVSALVAGGVTRPADATTVSVDNYLYSLSAPATATGTPVWKTNLGTVPNAQVFGLDYSAADNVLLANLMGRGAYVLYDVTTYYPEATSLVFGKAQNDSTPIASQLTDGTNFSNSSFGRQLIKEGAGTLNLSGLTALYSGGTELNGGVTVSDNDANFGRTGTGITFNAGTLKYASAYALDRPLIINTGGGKLDLGGNNVTQGAGGIIGAGQLTVAGTGNYTLTQTNTQSGGLAIGSVTDGGVTTVVASNDNNLGASQARVTLDQGKLTLASGFDTTLTSNQFNRPVYIGLSNGTIDTYALGATALSYTGGLIESTASGKTAGALYFTGTPFTMGANLKLNAFWGADLTVPTDMTLSGLAGVASGYRLTINGTYNPGNSPGTAESYGSIVLNSSSTLDIEIDGTGTGDGAGNYDRIVLLDATGTFTAGGKLSPVLRGISSGNNTYSPPLGQGFQIVTAPGGILGNFATFTQPTSGLLSGTQFDTVFGATSLSLYTTPSSYSNIAAAGVATNSNRQQIGGILQPIRPTPGVRENNATRKFLFDSLAPQTTSSLPVAMDQLAGVGYGQIIGMNFENSKFLADQMATTVALHRRGEGQHLVTGESGQTLGETQEEFWGMAVGRLSDWRGDAVGYNTYDVLGGVMAGVQKRLTPQSLAGFSLAYAGSSPSVSQNMGSGPMQNLQLMGYGSQALDDGFYVQGLLGGGGGTINTSRNLSMMNTSYTAQIQTANLAGSILAGWGTETTDRVRYETGVGINYLGMRHFGFNDSGNQSAYALTTQAGNTQSLVANLNATASIPFTAGQIDWRAHGLVNVGYETAANKITLQSNFLGSPITVDSGSIGRTRLNLGLGISGNVGKETKVALDVTNQSAQNWNATAANVSVRVGF